MTTPPPLYVIKGAAIGRKPEAGPQYGEVRSDGLTYTLTCNEVHVVVQSVALRGRDGGATAELGGEAAYALRAANGGGSDPYVLAPTIAFSCKDYGGDAAEDISPTMRAMGHSGSHANAGGQIAVCVTGSVTHTLKAEGFDASEDGTGRGQPIVPAYSIARDALDRSGEASDGSAANRSGLGIDVDIAATLKSKGPGAVATTMAVRRLMPIECHRLQGFPDDWCAVPIGPKGKIAADGPQYKQLGNSWAVNHARWVGSRIAMWLAAQEQPVASAIEPVNDDMVMLMWALAA